jgi:hypothetical protein
MIKKAQLDETNKVINIAVFAENSNDEGWLEYTKENPAFINGDYFDGYFYPPKPFLSWSRFQGTWQPPTPMPTESRWNWDEATLSWVEVELPTE